MTCLSAGRREKRKMKGRNEMKNKFKKIVATVAALAVAFTTVVVTDVTTASAATDYDTIYESTEMESANAGEEKKYNFTINRQGDLVFTLFVPQPVEITLSMYNSAGELLDVENNPLTISATDSHWQYVESYGAYGYLDGWNPLPNGDYTYGIKFGAATQYLFFIDQAKAAAKISDSKATITTGFTKKLTVSGAKVTKWSSSKKTVATVDSKGKVTAKKTGKATISAKLDNGQTVKCVVTVKANKYSAPKPSVSDAGYNSWGMRAYSASFDSKGNLVIKTRIVNNTNGRLTQIKNLKITVKNGSGKVVGKYSTSKKSISVPAYSTKDTSFTIAKSKIKKVDLRNATIECDGDGYGY